MELILSYRSEKHVCLPGYASRAEGELGIFQLQAEYELGYLSALHPLQLSPFARSTNWLFKSDSKLKHVTCCGDEIVAHWRLPWLLRMAWTLAQMLPNWHPLIDIDKMAEPVKPWPEAPVGCRAAAHKMRGQARESTDEQDI